MKKIMVLTAVFLLIGVFAVSAYTGVTIDSSDVVFNDSTGYPFVENGRTLVPLRAAMEAFGASVSWDDNLKTASVSYANTIVKCTVGESKIYRNGVKIDNDAAACIKDGRTYLPIRAVLEAFGATVGWNGYNVNVETEYGKFVKNMEEGGYSDSGIWNKWNSAVALQESGNFGSAAAQFMAIAPNFINMGDVNSSAMLYLRLGTCLSKKGDYKNASYAYRREAYYWRKAGLTEETTDAQRRSNLVKSDIKIYAGTKDPDMIKMSALSKTVKGIMLGAYAENDSAVYNPYDEAKFYMDLFPALTGKDHGGYLLYLPYGTDISHYASHIEKAKEKGKVIQIALEPHNGIASVTDESYLIRLASDMENSGCSFLLRFAGEMNDTTCKWYTPDAELYKEKFRMVANIFHTYAPSVPVIWSPNFYPESTMELYYPGDEYVDYVGISAYKLQQTETDPFGQGVDRSVYSDIMDHIVKLYGDRKPIIVSEGAPSYMDYDTMADITPFAVRQMREFYTYLPIRYPQVKMVFYFDSDRERWKFMLSGNQTVLDAYKEVISSESYTSSYENGPFEAYMETADNVTVNPEKTKLASHISYPYPENIKYVVYFINGEEKGTTYGIPYGIDIDFAPYSGHSVNLSVKAFGDSGLLLEKTVRLTVK